MARRKISQREAHATRRELEALKAQISTQRNRWASEYPGATFIGNFSGVSDVMHGILVTAARLDHALVGKYNEDHKTLNIYAARTK